MRGDSGAEGRAKGRGNWCSHGIAIGSNGSARPVPVMLTRPVGMTDAAGGSRMAVISADGRFGLIALELGVGPRPGTELRLFCEIAGIRSQIRARVVGPAAPPRGCPRACVVVRWSSLTAGRPEALVELLRRLLGVAAVVAAPCALGPDRALHYDVETGAICAVSAGSSGPSETGDDVPEAPAADPFQREDPWMWGSPWRPGHRSQGGPEAPESEVIAAAMEQRAQADGYRSDASTSDTFDLRLRPLRRRSGARPSSGSGEHCQGQ